jgi:pantoate--beta-alanine ligase
MIKVFTNRFDFNHYRNSLTTQTIGLVPTMGNLHKGHISLIEKSTDENDVTIVTIFVNPKQFGPNEDFDKYPRTLDADLAKISSVALLISASKDLVVFAPRNEESIYPKGFSSTISVGSMTQKFEGAIRPTHFDGVTTVVYRLFIITKAHTAYLGQKDVQQCLIINKMVKDLELPIKIHIMPIVRNSEGLALSSRNQYLSENERVEAMVLPHTLQKIEKLILTKQDYKAFVAETIKADSKWDYLEVLDSSNLEAATDSTSELVIVAAYRAGSTRLLDNILVQTNEGNKLL